jgi:hypothetical protein
VFDTGQLKIYYNDGDSAQWVDANAGVLSSLTVWQSNSTGINTTSNVGFGTTTASAAITVGAGGTITVGTGVTIESSGQATFVGVVTATSFVGSGAALTGIDATAIKDSGGNVKIQAQASDAIHTGVSTFQDIDVDGHTNLDNVSIAGVSTFTGNIFATGTFKFSKNGSESFEFDSGGNLLLNTVTPRIQLNDINSENDYQIMNGDGTFVIRDLDRSVSFYSVSSAGQQTLTGNVVLNNDLGMRWGCLKAVFGMC